MLTNPSSARGRSGLANAAAAVSLALEPCPDARHGLVERGEARRVGEAQIAVAEGAEAGAGDGGDPGLLEQAPLQRAAVEAGAGDVGGSVEGAARRGAEKAGEGGPRPDDHPPSLGGGC